MTLDAVARRISSHKGYVSGMERGKVNPPSPKVVRRIARAFGVDEMDLLELAEVDKTPLVIRQRMRARIADNPLLRASIADATISIPARTVVGEAWPPGKIAEVPKAATPRERGASEKAVRS